MQENKKVILWSIAGVLVLAVLFFLGYQNQKTPKEKPAPFITSFDDCVGAGYPVIGSTPRKCQAPDGFVYNEKAKAPVDVAAVATGGCFIGGCSAQICSDQPDAVSTCEYRAEYGCYKTARCERQSNNVCGWTKTPALTQCLEVDFNFDNPSK